MHPTGFVKQKTMEFDARLIGRAADGLFLIRCPKIAAHHAGVDLSVCPDRFFKRRFLARHDEPQAPSEELYMRE